MKTVVNRKFDGGHAEDIRTENTNECEYSNNFDILSNPHKLIPYIDTVAETMTSGTTTDYALSDVDSIVVGGNVTLVALGRESSVSSKPTFFTKSSLTSISSSWSLRATGVNNVVQNSLIVYKGFAYGLGDSGSAHNLQKFDGVSSVSTIGTITNTGYYPVVPRPIIHPEDKIMYMVDGNIISKYDGTTFTATAFTLPSDMVGVSLTYEGTYLVITCRPRYGTGDSMLYKWGRDTSLATLQESISLGATQVNIAENIDNNLYVITSSQIVGGYSTVIQNKLTASVCVGSTLSVVKELTLSSTFGTALNNIKVKKGNKLYFGFSNDTSIYVFAKNKSGNYVLSHDRALPSGTTGFNGLSIIGDFMFVAFNTAIQNNQFNRTISLSESQTYTATSTYRTTINPKMDEADRDHMKQLYSIQFFILCGQSSGTSNMKYSVDGSTFTTIQTFTNVAGIQVLEAIREDTDVEFLSGRELQFEINTTGNTAVLGYRYRYELLNQIVD